jgi:hypothetical protein
MTRAGEFSVYQFFEDESYEAVRQWVSAEEAITAFRYYTNNVTSRVGITCRVIITDGGDCVNMEWIAGKGVTFPLPTKDDSNANV